MSQPTDDIDELTDRVIDRMEPGFYDGKLVLNRRQAIALTGTTFSAAALIGVGFGQAEAQEAAGQVGTDSDRVDVFGATIDVASDLVDASGTSHTGELADASDVTSTATTSGYEVSIDGDVYEFVEE